MPPKRSARGRKKVEAVAIADAEDVLKNGEESQKKDLSGKTEMGKVEVGKRAAKSIALNGDKEEPMETAAASENEVETAEFVSQEVAENRNGEQVIADDDEVKKGSRKRGRQPKVAKNQKNAKQSSSDVGETKEMSKGAQKYDKEIKNLLGNTTVKVSLVRQEKVDSMARDLMKEPEVKAAAGTSNAKGKRGRGEDDDVRPGKVSKKSSPKSSKETRQKIPDVSALDFDNKSTNASGESWNLKIVSWNINGIRAWIEKDGLSYLKSENPDIVCFQETKCSESKIPKEANVEGYHCSWLGGDKDGYSGVGLLSKEKPLSVDYGIGHKDHDSEGRVITAEYDKFYLVAAYVPNSGRGLVRLDYRQKWDADFRAYLKKLEKKKPVILCGDLNVAHQEIDLAKPKSNKRNAGFTQEERDGFSALLSEGFVDAFRHLYPDLTGVYTFWTYMMKAREKNIGWRLDYFVLSETLMERVCDCCIRKDVMGSDHCPLVLLLSL